LPIEPTAKKTTSGSIMATHNENIARVCEAALQAHAAKLCVIPPAEDGTKRPLPNPRGAWAKYKTTRPDQEEIRRWYPGRSGLGIVTGAVSGCLESFDFDDRPTYEEFIALAEGVGLGELVRRIEAGYCDDTAGGGVRWLMRYPTDVERVPGQGIVLARRPKRPEEQRHAKDKNKTLIESPAYSIVAPTNGSVHPNRKPYVRRSGDFSIIASYSAQERQALFDLARTFDQMPRKPAEPSAPRKTARAAGARPGDDYIARTTWEEILEPAGWTRVYERGGAIYWRRPGKKFATSATTNYGGADLLYVFSTSTDFEAEKSYSRFAAYAVLKHGGDFRAAAQALAEQGYGSARKRTQEDSKDNQQTHNGGGAGKNHAAGISKVPLGSDEGLALQFADRHRNTLRYTAAWGKWHHFKGRSWDEDKTLLAFDFARTICREAAQLLFHPNEQKEATSAKKRAAVISLAREDRRIAATTEQWDSDIWVLNTPKGVIDLRTQEMRSQRPTDYLTKITAVAPGGDCPRWREFLKEISDGDEALQQFMQRFAGYSLTGDISEEALFFAYGGGANGKGTFLHAITGILADYHRAAPIATFTESRFEQHPTDLAMLKGARLVTASETQQGRRWDESRIKMLTGGDPVSARFMRQDFFQYMPHFKLFIAGNHKPRLRSVDVAIRRRFRLLPFMVTIPEAKRDPELKNKLRAEWPGILEWMLAGCADWQERGLAPPDAVMEATSAYLDAEDTLADWIEVCCFRNPNVSDTVQLLFASWTEWAEKAGERVGSKREFGDRLEEAGFKRERTNKAREIVGLKVLR
jgi:putative DNA primase/helicase